MLWFLIPATVPAQGISYDAVTGILSIPSVSVGSTTYVNVTLLNVGPGYTFVLQSAAPQIPPQPALASYDATSGLLTLPSVSVGTASYAVTMQNVGNYSFVLRTAETVSGLLLISISPASIEMGSGAFTLTANGSNFVSSSVIEWNGTSLTTTFVSATQLTASVPAANIAVPADAVVTVKTPSPGGGTSAGLKLSTVPFMTPAASSLTRSQLDAYLSRSLMMGSWNILQPFSGDVVSQYADNLRMIANVGAKHVAWAAMFFWSKTSVFDVEASMSIAGWIASGVQAQDPNAIVGAGIFETTSPLVAGIAVPDWVLKEFGQPVVVRNFDWTQMTYLDQRPSDSNPDTPAIDITRLESRMWYYYWARRYIDLGFEDIDLGEVFTVTQNDIPTYANYWDLVQRIRKYAAAHARRGFVLLSGQSYPADPNGKWDNNNGVHGIVSSNGYLALDYLYHGLRPKENANSPQDAVIANWQDVPFGKTAGGISPNGWNRAHMPYVVTLDPGGSPNPGVPVGFPSVWGWSEWDWWVNQSRSYRDKWLWYATAWVAWADPNGHFRVPGMGPGGGLPGIDWYHANTPWYSQSDPGAQARNQWYLGFNDEPTIKAIWSGTADPDVLNGDFSRPVLKVGQTDVITPDVPSWSFAGTAGVAASGSSYVGSYTLSAGQQVGFISGTASLAQPLIFPGSKAYKIHISAADRVVNGTPDSQSLVVSVDETAVGTVTLKGTVATTTLSLGSPAAGVHMITVKGTATTEATAIVASITIAAD
jgi:hypothetical protein